MGSGDPEEMPWNLLPHKLLVQLQAQEESK